MKNIEITYPDGTISVRSMVDQVKSMQGETPEFKAWFWYSVLHEKEYAYTRFGSYALTDEPITVHK